jgi:beta-galactosidase
LTDSRTGSACEPRDVRIQPHWSIRYNISAVPFAKYRVRLHFREPWFGRENGGIGGPGSRVFDVACNGGMLLKEFDILREGGSAPVVKTIDGIQASADGRIELSFCPS